jgi:hypothetical protein
MTETTSSAIFLRSINDLSLYLFKLAQRFGNVDPGETPSPIRPQRPRKLPSMLTRLPPKRSFAPRIRSQSAALTLGTRGKNGLPREKGAVREYLHRRIDTRGRER